MKPVIFQRAAIKALRRMDAKTSARIRMKIADYAADPQSQANNVMALTGRDAIRLRVGDYRVIMVDGVVLDIGSRGGIHR